jgi:hypothetical protein
MGAALGDLPVVEDDDLVGVDDRRQPVRDDQRRAVGGDEVERGLDLLLGVVSSAEVASSRMRIGGAFRTVRAMATRCFSPPDSFRPRSPTSVACSRRAGFR